MRARVSLLVLGVCGCVAAKGPTSGPAEPTGVETITAAELLAHATELSTDAYRGRETLTPGGDAAAAYLSDAFARLGLAPLPGRDELRVPYALERLGFLADGTGLVADGEAFEAGVDFAPFGFSDSGALEADLVFAGYGIASEDPAWDDYAGLDVTGKVVLVLRHAPREGDPEAPLAGSPHAFFRNKAVVAQRHGARGMLLVTDPLHHDGGDDLRLPSRLRLPVEPRPQPERKASAEPDPPFLAMHISQASAGRLVEGGLPALREAQSMLDRGDAPGLSLAARRVRLDVASAEAPEWVQPHNVVGYLPGADPERRGELVVVGAHYDHLGAFEGTGDTIYNGADDNASGTAGLLELAEAFAAGPRPPRSLVFVGFSGEEKGLLGSRALLAEGTLDAESVVFMLNLDMIGRNGDAPVRVTGDGFATELRTLTEAANAEVGLDLAFGGVEYSGNSDHHPFFLRDVPVMFFFSGLHGDYHQPADHADRLDAARMEQTVRVGYGVLERIAGGVTPRFVHQVFWLGAQVQVDPSGATVAGLDEGSRGARAGLRVGDVIAGVDGAPLERPRDVGDALRGIQPGASVTFDVVRAGATEQVTAERAKRGYLGVRPGGVSDELRKEHGLADTEGVTLAAIVEGGPAEQAGLRVGDVLIRIAGLPVGRRSLGRSLARIGAGETVRVVVVRDGRRVSLEMTLGERPQR